LSQFAPAPRLKIVFDQYPALKPGAINLRPLQGREMTVDFNCNWISDQLRIPIKTYISYSFLICFDTIHLPNFSFVNIVYGKSRAIQALLFLDRWKTVKKQVSFGLAPEIRLFLGLESLQKTNRNEIQ
jgi:hypothetical protein